MTYELFYGTSLKRLTFPDHMLLDILLPKHIDLPLTGEEEVRRAMVEPINSPPLAKLVKPGDRIVIVTSDITRPLPSARILPIVLEQLQDAGISDNDITVVFGLGSHRNHTQEEKQQLMGSDLYGRIRCEDSNESGYVYMGRTSRGTPVTIAKTVADADIRICLGNIDYHYFAGYSGGAKAIMPGVSDYTTIQTNHGMMTDPSARIGSNEGNIIREDIEESIAYCKVDFLVNVILDENKEIVKAVAGDVIHAHRAGCRIVDALYKRNLPQKADIVITSAGGYPKDINLYQAQKALENAAHAVKKGGTIILAAQCAEGFGNSVFESWFRDAADIKDILERISREFQLGGHKAVAVAKVCKEACVCLLSDLPDVLVKQAFLTPVHDLQSALDQAIAVHGPNASILLMPFAGVTLPCCQNT